MNRRLAYFNSANPIYSDFDMDNYYVMTTHTIGNTLLESVMDKRFFTWNDFWMNILSYEE